MRIKKSKSFALLDPHFVEIKRLILTNSTAITIETLNRKYDLGLTQLDLTNYLFNQKEDFDVVEYRKSQNIFDFNKAKMEDATRQHQPRFV